MGIAFEVLMNLIQSHEMLEHPDEWMNYIQERAERLNDLEIEKTMPVSSSFLLAYKDLKI